MFPNNGKCQHTIRRIIVSTNEESAWHGNLNHQHKKDALLLLSVPTTPHTLSSLSNTFNPTFQDQDRTCLLCTYVSFHAHTHTHQPTLSVDNWSFFKFAISVYLQLLCCEHLLFNKVKGEQELKD